MATTTEYPIAYPSRAGYLLPLLPAAAAIGFCATAYTTGDLYLYGVAVIPLAVAVLLGYMAYAVKHIAIVVSPSDVVVKVPLQKRVIPRTALVRESARLVDLAEHPEINTALRTNGVEMSGFKQGWFKLKNGEKALVALNDERNAVYVPTTAGYSLLVSPPRPREFLEQIQQ